MEVNKIKKLYNMIFEFIVVIVISALIGGGLGWMQGMISFKSVELAEFGFVGGIMTSILFSVLSYYLILKRKIDFRQFFALLVLCISVGIIFSLIIGPFSIVSTPSSLILGTIYIRFLNEKRTKL